ncbi:MAG: cytochrome P450, partial [Alphaproteobacteria bacterium]|nr:cytochrome P450 [Alphaproteobacteria bacterium]
PLPAISRGALQADRLAGVEIAKGTLVVISPYVVHRHRKLWIAPDIFDPGRFLAERESIDPFAFLPFGRGPRGCIGITFAMQEATLVLATLLAQCEFECVADQAIWPVHRITLTPRGGLNMRVRPRVSAKPAADRKAPEQISTGPAAEAGAPGSLEFTP